MAVTVSTYDHNALRFMATANVYTQNAKALASVTFTTAATNGAMFDAADTIWTPTSTNLVANFALIYNDTDTNDPPLYHYDFGGAITATFSPLVPFSIIWAVTGIARSVVA